MYCQFCGKQIHEFADVCIGCGKLLHQEKKINGKGRVFKLLSILVLVFSSIFFVIGLASFFVGMDNGFFGMNYGDNFFLNMKKTTPNNFWVGIKTEFFISLIVSLVFESCLAIMSLILLMFNNKKTLNIVSFSLSMGLLAFVGIIVFLAGV